jgi:hypothetical protein
LNSVSAGGISAVISLACAPAFALGAGKACGGSRRLDSLGFDMVGAVGTRGFVRPGINALSASSLSRILGTLASPH